MSADVATLDDAWRAAHPLPDHAAHTDKNARGRVLLVGGSLFVPGALSLTAEAVLRAGAGKLQVATVDRVAVDLGMLCPEAAMIGLPTDAEGEIAASTDRLTEAARHCDALLLGPGMLSETSAHMLDETLIAVLGERRTVILDAAAVTCARPLAPLIAARHGRAILTPHHGEMARLTGATAQEIADDPVACARAVSDLFDAVVVLKSDETVIAAPGGETLLYANSCVGLATGGSGDVLAGLIAGLAARGAEPFTAAAWGVWLHGEAGQAAAQRIGPIGFLARDLPAEVPRLMAGA